MPLINISDSLSVIKVFKSEIRSEADICVAIMMNQSEALKENLWFYTEFAPLSNNDIVFIDNKTQADLIVYFAENKAEAQTIT